MEEWNRAARVWFKYLITLQVVLGIAGEHNMLYMGDLYGREQE